jgi:hypothetical protein
MGHQGHHTTPYTLVWCGVEGHTTPHQTLRPLKAEDMVLYHCHYVFVYTV